MKKRLAAGFLALAALFLLPLRAAAEASVVKVLTEEKLIALTFDDGPHPRYTERILTVLEKYGVKATFFEIGVNVKNYPDAARAVAAAGHEIGNHTYCHPHLSGVGTDRLKEEVTACAEMIHTVTGATPVLYRPPEGARGDAQFEVLNAMGYRQILWSVDTNDWRGRSRDAIVKQVLARVGSGDIILMHDYVSGHFVADEALDCLIPELLARGYRFVTVSELLASGTVVEPHY
ncbi:MAG: polysaccharide deacetylase family protein [Clostridia bacterium]|nr:polysaccharide deacetylase family protein [Clostridia bacterium]MDY6184459.1 polysaccharide deacetylase family protein [Eubacteriales bacterium]